VYKEPMLSKLAEIANRLESFYGRRLLGALLYNMESQNRRIYILG
jgi:hypothetical protein